MTSVERGAWLECADTILAEEALRDRRGSMSPDELYAALVLTTGDRRAADLARSRRALERMQARDG
jgi:hypothetical protein